MVTNIKLFLLEVCGFLCYYFADFLYILQKVYKKALELFKIEKTFWNGWDIGVFKNTELKKTPGIFFPNIFS